MERHLVAQVAGNAEKDTITESKHKAKFAAAGDLSKAFCRFYMDQISGQSPYLERAPATDQDFVLLARRLVSLIP
jgi:hypothetical protein